VLEYDIWLVASRHQTERQIDVIDKLKAKFDFILLS